MAAKELTVGKKKINAGKSLIAAKKMQSRSHQKLWVGTSETEHQDTAQRRQNKEKELFFIESIQQ